MGNKKKLFTYRHTKPGQIKCTIDLSQLFSTMQLESFERKLPLFIKSDPYNSKIYKFNKEKQTLAYKSEQLIPIKTDNRPPLLLVLGNPASHSVENDMFFSFEKDGIEHRFWKIIRTSGVLNLPVQSHLSIKEQNVQRKQHLLELKYKTPFRIGLCVFISMPSGPSKDYSGVVGIQRLIGTKAMRQLEAAERERVLECTRKFLSPNGAVVTFQKNAWNGLRSENDPKYDINLARSGKQKGAFIGNSKISLFCVPPTRLVGRCREVLRQLLSEKYPDKLTNVQISNS